MYDAREAIGGTNLCGAHNCVSDGTVCLDDPGNPVVVVGSLQGENTKACPFNCGNRAISPPRIRR